MNVAPAFGGGTFIADKSVWARSHRDLIRDEFSRALVGGQIVTCSVNTLELLYSAQTARDFEDLEEELAGLQFLRIEHGTFLAARAALRELAGRSDGYHRVKVQDALIAATAQAAAVGVLHYDHDFDRLAEVLEFESRWVADPGDLD